MVNQINEQFKQQIAQAGRSGDAIIECRAKEGFLRMKIKWNPHERQIDLTKSVTETLSTLLQMMGVNVKIKIGD